MILPYSLLDVGVAGFQARENFLVKFGVDLQIRRVFRDRWRADGVEAANYQRVDCQQKK